MKAKQKINHNWIIYLFGVIALAMIPVTLASGEGLPMMNLWDLFVEQMFGNFWIAVIFIGAIYFTILMLSGISAYTNLIVMYYYFLAMAIGYGQTMFVVLFMLGGLASVIWQVIKWMENR